ncbi:endonuclease [Flavobacterium sp.]|uniref:endonuclease n=1 Tax=Flavobacterium sp. TaxID=239 RepID=UPI00286E7844|nr:endonuclease [Flavobacterium sp.]
MFKKLLLLLLLSNLSFSQVVINELDSDTPSADVKEFIELKSATPNFSLDGYVVVFFNASSTSPYASTLTSYAIDLDGLVTDGNGIVLLGNAQVIPSASYIFPSNTVQNGPDAVAIYYGNASDFPIDTPATATNLIDALAYSTNTTFAANLMSVLGETVSYNENINSLKDTQSIQRKTDGTYEVKAPTPRANNDGSGVFFNGIATTFTPASPISEGQTMTITFTTDTNVLSDLSFSFTLNNNSFEASDFTADLNATIAVGTKTVSKTIQILNDNINDGDENLKITLGTVPSEYIVLNNNISVRVNDINFVQSGFGTPLNPTYGLVANTKPSGYYDSLEGKSGAILKQAIQDIIANPAVVREHNYADVNDILKIADTNPENNNKVWLMYVEQPKSKLDIQTGSSNIGFWNREHIYAQSRGGFNLDSNVFPDGIDVWTTTDANDIEAGGADAHHIRAEDSSENSLRGNQNYGTTLYNGPIGSQGSWHGDVARSLFYMAVRYNGLNVVNGNPAQTPMGSIGDLATLLTWNTQDASDDFEMNRNNVIYTWQYNRNPFIDHPDLAEHIWGSKTTIPWSATLSNQDFTLLDVKMYPNPTEKYLVIDGLVNQANIEIFNTIGAKVYSEIYNKNEKINLNLSSGIYLVKIVSDNKSVIKKLIIQ